MTILHEILHMDWPTAVVLVAVTIASVVVYGMRLNMRSGSDQS